MTLLRAFWDAAREVAPDRRPPRRTRPSSCPGAPTAVSRGSGGTPESATCARAPSLARADYAGFGDLWAPFPTGVAPSGAFCAALDDDRRAALRAALRRRLGVGDAPFALIARAWVVAGVAAPARRGAAGRGS